MLIKPQICFFAKITLDFHFNTRNHFRDELLHLLSMPGCLQLSRMFICSKELSFTDLCIPHFAVESTLKFSFTRSLEDGFVGGT